MLIHQNFSDKKMCGRFYLILVIGVSLEALGARILMKCAKVGAIWPIEIGVRMIAGFTELPIKIIGVGIYA